jgi:hypothetical protein
MGLTIRDTISIDMGYVLKQSKKKIFKGKKFTSLCGLRRAIVREGLACGEDGDLNRQRICLIALRNTYTSQSVRSVVQKEIHRTDFRMEQARATQQYLRSFT